MKKRILYKVFSGFFIIILILLIVNQIAVSAFLTDFSRKASFAYVEKLGLLIRNDYEKSEALKTPESESVFFQGLNSLPGLDIYLADRNGKVIFGNTNNNPLVVNLLFRSEFQTALLGSTGESFLYNPVLKKDILSVAMPLSTNGQTGNILILQSYLDTEKTLKEKVTTAMMLIGIILLIISLFVTFIISRGFTSPIYDLVNASTQVAKGNFNVQVLFQKDDEFKVLAESFNSMTFQIRDLFEQLNAEREELKAIIYTMQGALWVIDEKDRIIFCNQSFRNLTGADKTDESPYWEFIRDSELDALVDEVRRNKKSVIQELIIHKKNFLFSAENVELKNHIVMTLSDISEIKKADIFKKNLIDNVSHEMKTPLTSIKGFIETLALDEKSKERKHYLEIIDRNVERLVNIVNDLLLYSSLENFGEFDFEKIELRSFISQVSELFEKRIQDKGLDFKIEMTGKISIEADRFQMEKVFTNLIDNAVKYTSSGGIRIRVRKTGENAEISVSDTGPGIPREHLSRIFERFYVVDKSRSRELGGTGLGLSIVKKIIQLHEGEIRAESEYGAGTVFAILLPISRSKSLSK